MSATRPLHGYRAHDHFMVRVPLWDQERFASLSSYRALRAAIPRLLDDDTIAAALSSASPGLVDQLRRLHKTHETTDDERKAHGALRSLRKYLVRMSHRPTPFGLLAGVGIGRFGGPTDMRVCAEPVGAVEVFPDYAWLMAFVHSLAEGVGARRLPLTANPYRQRIGDRLDIAQSNVFGTSASNHVDLLLTPPVQHAVDAALEGATADEVTARLREAHPDASAAAVDDLVDTLLAQGVLYPDIVPSLTPGREVTSMLDALAQGGAEVRSDREELHSIAEAMSSVRDIASLEQVLPEARRRQGALLPDFRGSTVSLNATVALASATLSEAVSRRVEEVAEVLTRTSFFPPRPASIVEYEQHFLERYGVGGEVPVLELLSAGRGLEAPSGYQLPPRSYPLPGHPSTADTRGPSALLAAYTTALLSGEALELTDDLLTAYESDDPRPPSATFDLFVRVLARSAAAVDAGDFDLAVLPDGLALGGRAAGRFTGILDGAADLVDAMLTCESQHGPSPAHLVQLRYLPDKARMANVARTSATRLDSLDVGVASDSTGGMNLEDVLVGNDGTSFFLRDRRSGERLRFIENHMLSPLSAPNVIRLLVELSTDSLRGFNIFDWGHLANAPFLPRVVRGRVIYSPARWNLPPQRLSISATQGNFAAVVRGARESLRMPARVTLVRDDNRLPLDLDTEIDVAILAEEQSRAAASGSLLTFEETLDASAAAGDDPGVVRGHDGARYAHELVVSVALPTSSERVPSHPHPPKTAVARLGVRTSQEWDRRWICVDVQAGLVDLDAVVRSHVASLLDATRALRDRWFFVRYPLPGHALRIRVRARSPRHIDRLRTAAARWAEGLIARRLITESALTGYVPEFHRYGGEGLYHHALRVFEATSRLAIEVARSRDAASSSAASDEVIGVCLLSHLYSGIGVTHADLGIDPSTESEFRQFYRENRTALMTALSDPREALAAAGMLDQVAVVRTLEESRDAMRTYAQAYRHEHTEADLRSAASAAMHMAFNRIYPVGNAVESRALGLWALAAEAAARRERAFSDLGLIDVTARTGA